jgi:hypothetical protein
VARRYHRRARAIVVAVAALGIALLAGCGDSGDDAATFQDPAVPVTFEYPSSLQSTDDPTIAAMAGGGAAFTRALALDDDNVIAVQTYDLNVSITEDNLDQAKAELDPIVGQIADGPASGEQVEFAGLPGFDYQIDISPPTDGQSRLVFLFSGTTEVEINCQSTPEKRAEISEICDQVLSTLKQA